jgi:hypothetical protein
MSDSAFVYRILDFEHLVEMFKTKSLRLTRPALWEDPYEAPFDHWVLNNVFAQSWSSTPVSDAMWRIYSPSRTGVRIRARRDVLLENVRQAAGEKGWLSMLEEVEYIETRTFEERLRKTYAELCENFDVIKALETVLFKRTAFAHESEVRLAIHALPQTIDTKDGHLALPFAPADVISDVMVDPRASDNYFDVVQYYLRAKLKFRGEVRRSKLYSPFEVLTIEPAGG